MIKELAHKSPDLRQNTASGTLNWLNNFKLDKVVGACGPFPDLYVKNLRENGIGDIILYENSDSLYRLGKEKLKKVDNVILINGPLESAPYFTTAIWDIRSYDTIKKNLHWCIGFKDNFVLTFNKGDMGLADIRHHFFSSVNEEDIGFEYTSKGERDGLYSSVIVTTDKDNRFKFTSYRDIHGADKINVYKLLV